VLAADVLMAFTEFPGQTPGRARGGRHVEFGIAFAKEKRLMIVGPRENIFHWLPSVEVYPDFEQAKGAITL
jgi:hypothetical protein